MDPKRLSRDQTALIMLEVVCWCVCTVNRNIVVNLWPQGGTWWPGDGLESDSRGPTRPRDGRWWKKAALTLVAVVTNVNIIIVQKCKQPNNIYEQSESLLCYEVETAANGTFFKCHVSIQSFVVKTCKLTFPWSSSSVLFVPVRVFLFRLKHEVLDPWKPSLGGWRAAAGCRVNRTRGRCSEDTARVHEAMRGRTRKFHAKIVVANK